MNGALLVLTELWPPELPTEQPPEVGRPGQRRLQGKSKRFREKNARRGGLLGGTRFMIQLRTSQWPVSIRVAL